MCCAGWLNRTIGDLKTNSVEEVWNSTASQEIRKSIHDGSFRYCSYIRCPFLKSVSGPVQKLADVDDPELADAIARKLTVLPYGPRELSLSYDRSCNLSCPSCRNDLIVESASNSEIHSVQETVRNQAFSAAQHISISGSGDPFASPSFSKLLQTMKVEELPNLKNLHLHTNALLWTPEMWETISPGIRARIGSTLISLDAATAATYVINRRGGNWERLMENLAFISSLRRQGALHWMCIAMVVQENNFRELPALVRLGRQLQVDRVLFTELGNWGTYTDEDFISRWVHHPQHPQHAEFVRVLRDPDCNDPIVEKQFTAAHPLFAPRFAAGHMMLPPRFIESQLIKRIAPASASHPAP